jgi:hypothetical protein
MFRYNREFGQSLNKPCKYLQIDYAAMQQRSSSLETVKIRTTARSRTCHSKEHKHLKTSVSQFCCSEVSNLRRHDLRKRPKVLHAYQKNLRCR